MITLRSLSVRCVKCLAVFLAQFYTFESTLSFLIPTAMDTTQMFTSSRVGRSRLSVLNRTSFSRQHVKDSCGTFHGGRLLWGTEGNSGDATDNGEEDSYSPQSEGGGKVNEESEEPPSIAALVEKTFVMAAAANSYVLGLKAFIEVVKEAYERGYTVPALTMEVSFVPTKTAGRDLFPDEVELRSVWIALVYLTLEQARWPQKIQRPHEISARYMDQFADFVGNVMTAAAKGHTLQTLKLEEVMRRGAEPRTPMEAAVLSQSMRIVFATLDIMKEGWSG